MGVCAEKREKKEVGGERRGARAEKEKHPLDCFGIKHRRISRGLVDDEGLLRSLQSLHYSVYLRVIEYDTQEQG